MKFKYWIYVLLWLIILFVYSSDLFSYHSTRKIIKDLLMYFNPNIHIRKVLNIHEFLRKALHVVNYAILSWLLLCAFVQSSKPLSRWSIRLGLLIVFICLLYSVSDEWRQSFSKVRTSRILDVYLDMGGALLTQVVCFLIVHINRRRNHSQTLTPSA